MEGNKNENSSSIFSRWIRGCLKSIILNGRTSVHLGLSKKRHKRDLSSVRREMQTKQKKWKEIKMKTAVVFLANGFEDA